MLLHFRPMTSRERDMAAGQEGTSEAGTDMLRIRERSAAASRLLEKAVELKQAAHVKGMQKLERKIKAERSFLESLLSGQAEVKEQHISSSNLLHLEAVLHICEHAHAVVAVEQSFCYLPPVGSCAQSLLVDVVACEGNAWIRAFARNRKSLHRKWLGDGNFGERSVVEIAESFLEASDQNKYQFESPKIIFAFFDGITQSISDELRLLGVAVVGPVFPDDCDDPAPSLLEVAAMFNCQAGAAKQPMQALKLPVMKIPEHTSVNLDVSAMVAWVSSLAHGGASYKFQDPVLQEQSQQELADPVWPHLQAATKGKQLIACTTAIENFKSIVETIGGVNERKRGRDLLALVKAVDDSPSSRAKTLKCSGSIKPRSKIIFGTGDSQKAVTLTANVSFLRGAVEQGVCFNTVVHPSRVLSEQKQL